MELRDVEVGLYMGNCGIEKGNGIISTWLLVVEKWAPPTYATRFTC